MKTQKANETTEIQITWASSRCHGQSEATSGGRDNKNPHPTTPIITGHASYTKNLVSS